MINDILQGKIDESYKVLRLASDMSKTYYQNCEKGGKE